ncbi:MAG: hypothetical protein V1808_02420 [Candidatus Daviesbacteria bacterium]
MAHFYSHLIEIEEITIKLEEMNLSNEQKLHLASLLDSTIHHTVLDLILSKLSEEDRKDFLRQLENDSEDKKIMEFLSVKVENIEEEIKEVAKKLKKELHEDIEEAKKNG